MGESGYDVIAVGGGSNGLIAAAYLAKAGKRVLVLERAGYLGGGVASGELTAPGFIHERHGTIHAKIMANPLITADELELRSRFGLTYVRPKDSFGAIFQDGSFLGLSENRERTLASLAAVVPEDVDAYRRFADLADEVVDALIPGFFSPPTSLAQTLSVLEASPATQRLERMMLQSACDVICEHFSSDKLRVALLRLVAELLILHPDEKGTGLFAVVAVGYIDRFGFGLPRGGGNSLIDALLACLREHGATVQSSTEVAEVVLKNGCATGVRLSDGTVIAADIVLAAVHPHHLGDRVPGLPRSVVDDARAVEPSHYTGFVVQAALTAPLSFRNRAANDCALVTVGASDLPTTLRAFDDLKRGRLSATPMLWSTAMPDSSRSPAGKGILHCYCLTVLDAEGTGASGWAARADGYALAVLDRLWEFVEPFTVEPGSTVRVLTPVEHEQSTPSFARGDLNGVGMFLHQTGGLRPTAALSGFAVPGADGLYLVGPFMHPGGGITGGGRATAVKVLTDLGLTIEAVAPPRIAVQA